MDLQLTDKTAFVSGSTQGIGLAIARALVQEGATVVLNGRTPAKVAATVAQLRAEIAGARVSGLAADFADAAQVQALLAALPPIDILVNNVGVFDIQDFYATQDAEWQRLFEVNVLSGVRLARALLPAMVARNWGRIIFISSEAGVQVPGNMLPYALTKTAQLSLSRGLAELTRQTGVTVNSVIGGPTYSEGVASAVEQLAATQQQPVGQVKEALMQALNPTSLLQRFIEPAEVASLVTYLASPHSAATNGAALRVDGGKLPTLL